MADSTPYPTADGGSRAEQANKLPTGWLSRWPWVTFLLPMVAYMVLGSFEPKPPATPSQTIENSAAEDTAPTAEEMAEAFGDTGFLPQITYEYYPYVYTAKIALVLVTMLLVLPGYRTFPWRVSGLSVGVGVVGVALWIVLCQLQLEIKMAGPVDRYLGSLLPFEQVDDEQPTIGLLAFLGAGQRSAYNPLEQLQDTPMWAYLFLAVRFAGLALIVPVIEEFFLRGFLMRYTVHDAWWQVPFGSVNRAAVVVGTAIPMLMHPGELLAALVWFSMVTWLMVRTRSIWDCVVAHAVTNFLLGVYVVTSGQWQLM
ncbi:MAG: CAAX prenyl protease-related protein [Planctomycetes bacterium]|nr:CAAX prenyl protease-related protein [Planctomycetota bacterium]